MPLAAFAEDGTASSVKAEAPAVAEQYEGGAAEYTDMAANSLDGAAVKAAAVITPVSVNSSATASSYVTLKSNETHTIHMPSTGTVGVFYTSSGSPSMYIDGNYRDDYETFDADGQTGYISYWYLGAGDHTLSISCSYQVRFGALYAPAYLNITAASSAKTYVLGRPANSSTVSSFKVKVPSNGYLDLTMGDDLGKWSVYFKTSGFSDYEYLSSSDARRYVGVKKGTYTISVKSYTPIYGVKIKFNKVKEAKYGTKKSKAKTIKRNKTIKGLIITNKKKAHWYKFKNPKLKKVTITIKGKTNGGGKYGGYKITMYDKRGSIGTTYISSSHPSVTIKPYTLGKGNKLVKGTYRLKVQSYKGGSGYFTVKWK